MNSTPRRRYRQISPSSSRKRLFTRSRFRPFSSETDSWISEASHGRSAHDRRTESLPPVPRWKRSLDVSLVLLILPLVLLLALGVFCWIRLVSPGNVLFRQTRVGRGGKTFTIYKFRSMSVEALTSIHEAHVEHLIRSNGPMAKLDFTGDPRLIKGGSVLRMSGLDELPQLINVLRGEMSLVGPRPCMRNEFALYGADQRRRFEVLPGLTGLWQVRRDRHTTFRQMVGMDTSYVERCSPILDLQIMLQTPAALLHQLWCYRLARKPGFFSDSVNAAGFGRTAGISHKLGK